MIIITDEEEEVLSSLLDKNEINGMLFLKSIHKNDDIKLETHFFHKYASDHTAIFLLKKAVEIIVKKQLKEKKDGTRH